MKIELSPVKIIPGAITVWSEPTPDVDIVMDLKNLTFRFDSISEIFAFHVCDHLFEDQVQEAIKNWYKCLKPGGKVNILNDNFEYIVRSFIGGEISIDLFNSIHNHPCQLTRDNLLKMLKSTGFREDDIVVWLEGNPEGMVKEHFEFILTATKK